MNKIDIRKGREMEKYIWKNRKKNINLFLKEISADE